VFISHAVGDRGFVEQRIKPLLECHGIRTWWSQEDIRGGQDWKQALKTGMRDSDWFLVVLSPRSERSEWVHTEVNWALADKPHRILPVLAEPCTLAAFPAPLGSLHFVDFSQNPKAAGRRILADMIHQLNKEARGQEEKVEQLSQDTERLKEENVELARGQRDMQARLDGALAFDGTWTHSPPKDVPRFRPLAERQAPIIAIGNLKGGVGKTTLTANIAASLWTREPKQRVLLLDLDYQANLTQTTLDRKTILRLRDQQRMIDTLFADEPPEPRLVSRCAEPVLDDRQRGTEGAIVASDDYLGVREARAQVRWLVGQDAGDVRFRLRHVLHAEEVQRAYNFILVDCPPRLTTACINALAAADFVLIPVLLDEKSTEGAPRFLQWLRERREVWFPALTGVGVVANKTKGVAREEQEWDDLMTGCRDAWGENVTGFETMVPFFTESAMGRKFPACYREMGPTFARLVEELRGELGAKSEVKP
jgi:cellulose biosynthesis protein BcsQ